MKPIILPVAFLYLTLLVKGALLAQPSVNEALAQEYYSVGEYSKAVELYEEIYRKNQSTYIYDNYFNCLIFLEDYKQAIKISEKQWKDNPMVPRFRVDQIFVHRKAGNEKEAERVKKDAVQWAESSDDNIIGLSAAFEYREMYQDAVSVLIYGKGVFAGNMRLNVELARIYGLMGENALMFDEYLLLLDSPLYTAEDLGSILQDHILEDPQGIKSQILKERIIDKVQKSPSNAEYSRLLIWFYIQMKEFDKALVQAKAFEKRNKGDGESVYSLGEICISNASLQTASEAFEWILDQGESNPYFYSARSGLVQVKFHIIRNQVETDYQQASNLRQEIALIIAESGINRQNVDLIRQMAYLDAFVLGNPDSAIIWLTRAIDDPFPTPMQKAQLKLDLGDAMLSSGEVWEAMLLYAQVEKAFTQDTIGFHAKFKTARLYYFLGEFEYASGQLEVLRGSTSKLIANDAMELSLLIQDNVDYDSSYVPLELYARAEMLDYMHQPAAAIKTLDSLLNDFPIHPIRDEALLRQAQLWEELKQYEKAIVCLNEILAAHYDDILADNALIMLAGLYENILMDKDNALKYYQQLLVDFPGSAYAEEARARFRALRGDE